MGFKKKKDERAEGGKPGATKFGDKQHKGQHKVITDPRFAPVHSDPRFQNVPTKNSKVNIDPRFKRMFTDKNFASSSASFDKRGKAKPNTNNKSENNPLRHYYRIEKEEEEEALEDQENSQGENSEDSDGSDEDINTEMDEKIKEKKLRYGDETSESESSNYSYDEDDDDGIGINLEDVDNYFAGEEENIPRTDEDTNRLGVVNLDWRHFSAVRLFAVLTSFVPNGGQILSVDVYPTEFGIQRMKEEETRGPLALSDDDKDSEDSSDEVDEEKIREYEKSKLRYFHAVVVCDSVRTASHIYKECDGLEFERSSNKMDLRIIPDCMEFKHPPRDSATELPPDYVGTDFCTRALQLSKVDCSWDEDEPCRAEKLTRKYNDYQRAEMELKEYLASDGSSDEEDENDDAIEMQSDKNQKKKERYRALLLSKDAGDGSDENGEEDGQDIDMEVTFNTGIEDISKRILEKKNKESETVWEAHLRKRNEKKKARKNKSKHSSSDESGDDNSAEERNEQPDDFFVEEPSAKKGKVLKKEKQPKEVDKEVEASRAELELLLADDKGENTKIKGYNLKQKKAKGKKDKQVSNTDKLPETDYDDPRFSSLFNSSHYALDPTDPQFKRSAAYARQLAQKQRQTESQVPSDDLEMAKKKKVKVDELPSNEKQELSALLKSVKMKSKQDWLPSITKKDKVIHNDGTNLEQSVKKKRKKIMF